MLEILLPVAILAAVYLALAAVAWRRPLLGRLAWREASRRPGHSLLLVFGMMFSTAAILGMEGVTDTIGRTLTGEITRAWGRTDITVSERGEPFSADIANKLAADPRVAAGAADVHGGFFLVGSMANLDRRLTASPVQIATVSPSGANFGTFTLIDGRATDGGSLANDEVILSTVLARRVEAQTGDRLRLNFAVGSFKGQVEFHVAGIIKPGGSIGLAQQPVLYVTPAAIQSVTGAGYINIVRISAKGEGQQEIDNAKALAPAVRAVVAEAGGGSTLVVREVKAEDLATTDEMGRSIRPPFVGLSFFIVLAATALVVNLALALAEERRPRLAVLRALGLTRTGLILVAVLEGAFYSLAAAVVGILPGAAYTYFVDARPMPGGNFVPDTSGNVWDVFSISAASITFSVCLGALITLATILVVSIRTSRMAITSAIRDLPDPARHRRRSWIRFAAPLVLIAAGSAMWLQGSISLRTLGGAAFVLAASMLAAGRMSDRIRATLLGTALVAWSVVSLLTASIQSFTFGDGAAVGFVTLVIAVFGAAILISANLRALEVVMGIVSGRYVATLRPPLAYLTRRPVRAGLATGSFALVVAVLAYFAMLLPSLGPDPKRPADGYDVRVTALGGQSFSVPGALQGQVVKAESFRTLAYVGPKRYQFVGSSPTGWSTNSTQLYSLTDQQLDQTPLTLSSRDPRYSSDRAVWQAIRNDSSLVVASVGGLGYVSFIGRTGEVRVKTIGILSGVTLYGGPTGYLGSESTFNSLSISGSGTTMLIKTAPGINPATFARDLRLATFGEGVDAITYAELASRLNESNAWFTGFFTNLLQVAVVIGVLSLGILTLRAAIERRRSIGVLRALGYRPRQVLSGLLVEAGTTATVGIVAGIGVGLAIGWIGFLTTGTIEGRVDLAYVLLPAAFIYAAVLLVTIGPAIHASRLPASEALRIMS